MSGPGFSGNPAQEIIREKDQLACFFWPNSYVPMTGGVFEQPDSSGEKMGATFAFSLGCAFIRKCSLLPIEGIAHQIDAKLFWGEFRGRAYSNFDFLKCLEHSGVVIPTNEQVEHLLSKYGVEDVTTQKGSLS